MPSWRDSLLAAFVPRVSKLTLVADPDGLLTEEQLARALRDRGFDLIEFTDAVEFRYAYESRYRATWDQGESTDLVVILRLPDTELDSLPYDLLQAGRRLSFTLGEIFPHLSYPVIEQLDRSLLDLVFAAQAQAAPERLGDNVYGIAAELLATDVDLLRALLRLHYGHQRLPPTLPERLIQVLTAKPVFAAWPLEKIIPDADAFFAFLQERWPLFLAGLSAAGGVQDQNLGQEAGKDLHFSGPGSLPFDHQDIRVYIDNLFVEGKLAPVQVALDLRAGDAWLRSGIRLADGEDESTRIARLFDLIDQDPPSDPWSPGAWLAFATKWAELTALVHRQPPGPRAADPRSRLNAVGDAINARFGDWLARHFASLIKSAPGPDRDGWPGPGPVGERPPVPAQGRRGQPPAMDHPRGRRLRLDTYSDLGVASGHLRRPAAALFPRLHPVHQRRRAAVETILGGPWLVAPGCCLSARPG